MKNLILAVIFIFCFAIFAFAQNGNLVCPKIEVHVPAGLVTPGEVVTFTAKLSEKTANSNLEFEWTVSRGTIIDQQGKPEIRVTTTEDMEGTNLTATVKVKGLPENCNIEASETAVLAEFIIGEPVDSYGKRSLNDERGTLDYFFVSLQNNIGSRGYIYFGIDMSEDLKAVKKRISELMKHIDFREVSRSLLIIDVCYSFENQTVLWIVPDGAKLPDYGECERVDIDLK